MPNCCIRFHFIFGGKIAGDAINIALSILYEIDEIRAKRVNKCYFDVELLKLGFCRYAIMLLTKVGV